MDIISHGLYGGVAFGRMRRRDYVTAFLFGIGPDLLAFAPLFIINLVSGGTIGRPILETIPPHVFTVYGFTHSFVVYAVFLAFIWFLGKKHFAKLTLAWPLHILVDIPTHDTTFFPTLFLWPISDFHINGISWGQQIIFIPNVILLPSLYAYWYIQRRKTRSQR